jgi:hypothetical protein
MFALKQWRKIFLINLFCFMIYNPTMKGMALEGIYDSNNGGREAFFEALKHATTHVIAGSYKLSPELVPAQDLL